MDLEAQLLIRGELERRRRLFLLLTVVITQVVYYYEPLFLSTSVEIPHHTTILTGSGWILELLNGHPDRIKMSLGVTHDAFNALVQVLVEHGFKTSHREISVEEQLGIFLHTCVTGLSTHHVGERFQHSPTTISEYFKEILVFFSTAPFYTSNVKRPTADTPMSTKITSDPRFIYFSDCIGAVDGTHIPAFVPVEEHLNMRNRKGFISQNCLFACDFNLTDATMWYDAHSTQDFCIPEGKYLLADAGFGRSDALLVPYRGVRYHLEEWRQSNLRPQDKKELFNLRHANLRDIIEQIFGILKRKWRILLLPPEFNMDIQARIPAALCALYNFIHQFDPDTFFTPEFQAERLERSNEDNGDTEAFGVLAEGAVDAAERRDRIAEAMWRDYCR